MPVLDPDSETFPQGVCGVEGPAENSVGGGAEGDRVGKSWWNARDLLADERCSRAVLDFLSTTNVGMLVQALGDVAREASDWELPDRREREEERRAEAEEVGAAGGAPVPTHALFHGIRTGRGGAVGGGLRFLLLVSN